ncbi:hypothetical protein J2S19_002914 [Metabacillus malikii]|uniref:Uncharacterized protein n=1 Tax=Metabacillus malikii TaxID=1504265 RepID=A0ABT9ZH85_9BACI|nr:hypothetical protein [Metabacillus malikii]
MGEVRREQAFAPRRSKSADGLPNDVQTGGPSTDIKESR